MGFFKLGREATATAAVSKDKAGSEPRRPAALKEADKRADATPAKVA